MLTQNNLEHIKDKMEQGLITVDQANVEMVLSARIRVITGKCPKSVRSALNSAVKSGILSHKSKDAKNNMPEVYYNPNFEHLAIYARNKHRRDVLNSLLKCCV